MKPQLAEDAILDRVRFPCGVQPKIDGVRALTTHGGMTGRSLKQFEGFGITDYFSHPDLAHNDGEMTEGDKPNCTERLCSRTTGAMGRFDSVTEMANLHWWLFDRLTPKTIELPYIHRYEELSHYLEGLRSSSRIHQVPLVICRDRDHMMKLIAENTEAGYEGTITRNLAATFKPGRATQKGQEIWRVKPWDDAEMLVTGFTEGATNTNEAKKNALGRTERSSAKAGKIPNGQVGSIQGTLLADCFDKFTRKLLFPKGLVITVGSGEMTEAEAIDFFKNPHKLVGHIVTFKHMTHGTKDLPRMATYKSHRSKVDL